MNYRGSYRKLLGNANAALMAAIEVYNKPTFSYRDECAVILLLNAWELLLKAILSGKKQSIYYPKRRKEKYKTLSWQDAFRKASTFLPADIGTVAVRRNLDMLGTYRDNAVHFYNAPDFPVLVHALAQTSIVNFRDLLEHFFGERLEERINWRLLPIGIEPAIDVPTYLSRGPSGQPRNPAVAELSVEASNFPWRRFASASRHDSQSNAPEMNLSACIRLLEAVVPELSCYTKKIVRDANRAIRWCSVPRVRAHNWSPMIARLMAWS